MLFRSECQLMTISSRRNAMPISLALKVAMIYWFPFKRLQIATSKNMDWSKMSNQVSKPFAITLNIGSSLANHTGSWRTERPTYVNRMPPCNNACPAGEDVQGWLYEGESGNYEKAWKNLVRDNPFPAIMGRICYHPCQTACNRADVDEIGRAHV